jgi:splicing factor U2AF subunit
MINSGQVPGDPLSNASSVQMQSAFPQLTRQARRLYCGNLPTGMGLTEKMLTEFFNATVTSLGIKTPQPVLSSWLSSQGTFCFVEFRGCQDANICMGLLQGITLGGRSLRVGRPADYKPPPPHLENYIVGFPPGQSPPGGPSSPGQMDQPFIPSTGTNMYGFGNGPPLAAGPPIQFPVTSMLGTAPSGPVSLVVLLENMVKESELKDDEEFKDILSDVKDECSKFGTVEKVVIPRPYMESKEEDESGPRTGVGVGRIFVLFNDTTSSQKAQATLNGRLFNENTVKATFYQESDFRNRIYGL